MIGAIAGDIIGSVYEGRRVGTKGFSLFVPASRFTDDTVMSVAVANAIRENLNFASCLRNWGRRYPYAGYGGWFHDWLFRDDAPAYNSFGNGSAMRVAAVGWARNDLDSVLQLATQSAEVTHNHPEGIRGACAIAAAVFLGRTGHDKESIAALLTGRFAYDCSLSVDELQKRQQFDVTCQGTVPAAAVAFLQSEDYEDAVRNAVSFGGDADTLACITGAMAEAYYGGVPDDIQHEVFQRLDGTLIDELMAFVREFRIPIREPAGKG